MCKHFSNMQVAGYLLPRHVPNEREREREGCLQDQHTHMHIVIAGLERERRETSAVAHASGELLPDHFRFWSTA